MKIALIPPIPELGKYETEGIHLMLAHLLSDKDYVKYYAEMHKRGEYLILDNSAHEFGKGNPIEDLFDLCMEVGADEVVVPDVLFDRRGTIQGAKKTLAYLRTPAGVRHWVKAGQPALMFVPQGNSRKDWKDCYTQLLYLWSSHLQNAGWDEDLPVVFGVSKDYDYVRGGISSLVGEIKASKMQFKNLRVHCLGWPADLWSIARVAREHPWVRSTDSAKPFVYAWNEVLLEPGGAVPTYPHREKEYFTTALTDVQHSIAVRNVEVYQATARDEIMESAILPVSE